MPECGSSIAGTTTLASLQYHGEVPFCLAVHTAEEKLMTTSPNQNHLIEASTRILDNRIVPSTRPASIGNFVTYRPGA